MTTSSNFDKYLKAIEIGFDYYGLNGFYEMHEDVSNNPDNPWGYALEVLNELNYQEFEKVCEFYLQNK